MLIGSIASMFLAGWVAGYLNRKNCCNHNLGALYGFIAWCVALVIMVLIASQTSQFIAGNLYTISNQQITDFGYNEVLTAIRDPNTTVSKSNNSSLSDEEVKFLAIAFFLTFIMFFIGALSSAIGGYCGLKRKEDTCCEWTNVP